MIAARYPGSFDQLWGPLFICAVLFVAILANFVFRLADALDTQGENPLSITKAWAAAGGPRTWKQ